MKQKILFADDDPEIREVVAILLDREGYEVIMADNGYEAVEKANESVDLIILDVMMPGLSGVEACARIRERSTAPVLFLTARSKESDKARGFEAGGDDYLIKPFSNLELVSRVKAMLRRYCEYKWKGADHQSAIALPGLSIHMEINEVTKNGERVLLTDLEYRILLLLAKNRNKIFTSQDIYEHVWMEPFLYTSNNTVMVHVRNLRKKLEDDAQNPKYIENVWGKGYRIG